MEPATIAVSVALKLGELASAVRDSLSPDNINVPDGLKLRMELRPGGTLEISVTSPLDRIDTLASTIDEMLEHASLAEKVLSEAEND